ncbi:MAG: YdcF family protein [Alphaproteobacteria bacterium]|nr:YdcF family protein [Alphaproteobacteria bacterium]
MNGLFDRGRRLLGLLAVAALLWLGALVRFIADLPREVTEPARHTDAIVVFTGGPQRVAAGLALLQAGQARRLLISGVHPGTSKSDIQAATNMPMDLLLCCVDLGFVAANTTGNAVETAAWVRRAGAYSLRVVTASYHMPRSLVELQRRLPEVELVPHPVFPPHFNLDRWWHWPGTAALLFEEGNKYIFALLRARIDGWSGGGLGRLLETMGD